MATLILSTVGTMAGGPIGGMLGTLVGSAIDQQLMGGGPRRGPRIGDLSVQTSSYGTMIPQIFGAMRVAGTIIWATDLKEGETLQGDGKSGPESVAYLYSVSFAVALSARPATRIGRIWADGQLIRGAAGDFKVGGRFRFLDGSEDQPLDPLIGSIEGPRSSPAYRGLALAVFEDLELAPFGNRIPNLTFELIAADGGEPLGALLEEMSGGAIRSDDPRTIAGYALHGSDRAAAIAPLIEGYSLDLVERDGALRTIHPEAARRIDPNDLGASGTPDAGTRIRRQSKRAGDLPSALSFTYHDRSRDYLAGVARSTIPAEHRSARSLALALVSDSDGAKRLVDEALRKLWASRETLSLSLPIRYVDLSPGDLVAIDDVRGTWVVEDMTIERMAVTVNLRAAATGAPSAPSDPGRAIVQPDIVAEPSSLILLDLSSLAGQAEGPSLQLAVTSPVGGYRRVPIVVDSGGATTSIASAATEAVSGTCETVLANGPADIVDRLAGIVVRLTNADHWLQSCSEEELASGRNLAAVGDEIIQFADAEALGAGRFRLSVLARGRGGSEWAISAHGGGEAFVLLNPAALATIPFPPERIGQAVKVTAYGPANATDPPSATRTVTAESVRPLSPCHVRAQADDAGGRKITWIGRSRAAWSWLDSVEAPRDADFGGYRVTLAGSAGAIERTSDSERLVLAAADIASVGPGATIAVCQVGAFGLSRPAIISID